MKSLTKKAYWIVLVLAMMMLVIIDVHERVEEVNHRAEEQYTILTDYTVKEYEEKSAPAGMVQEYSWTLDHVPEYEGALVIYTSHQDVEVYLDEEQVYSLTPGKRNYFSGATGCSWAKIQLNEQDEGSLVRVLIRPLYQSSISNIPKIYYGSYGAICTGIIKSGVPILLMGAIAVLVGLGFILFVLVNRKNREIDPSLSMLGIFSVFAGLWKICDVPTTPLIFGHPQALSAIALISISIMGVSYMFYIRRQFTRKNHWSWDAMCAFCCASLAVIVILQLTGVADVRQTLVLCHLTILCMIIYLAVMIIREIQSKKLSGKLKTTVIYCLICFAGAMIDLVTYYYFNDSDKMIYGMLAFLIYVLAMGYHSLKETLSLINRGRKARHFEQMAIHDALTGLYNRAYFTNYIKNDILQKQDCHMVTLDVNNLKLCNDTYGHECGDRLLKNCADMIKQVFNSKGDCIRMGGDEFMVIMRNTTEEEMKEYLRRFQELAEEFNATHVEEFPVEIAYGTAFYNDSIDYDFNDTMRRADKKMYQMKLNMKTESGQRCQAG